MWNSDIYRDPVNIPRFCDLNDGLQKRAIMASLYLDVMKPLFGEDIMRSSDTDFVPLTDPLSEMYMSVNAWVPPVSRSERESSALNNLYY